MAEQQTSEVWALIELWMSTLDWPPSQRKMADRLEVDKSTITDWKYGRGPLPPREVMERLALMIRLPYRYVLDAFMADHGYRDRPADPPHQSHESA